MLLLDLVSSGHHNKKNNKNQVFIKDCWLCNLYKVIIDGPDVDIVEKIKKTRDKDKKIVKVVEEIKKTRVKILQGKE